MILIGHLSRTIYYFKLWAYVLMPHHVHLLIWPLDLNDDIGRIEGGMKGVMAKRYRKHLSGKRIACCVIHSWFRFKGARNSSFVGRGGDLIACSSIIGESWSEFYLEEVAYPQPGIAIPGAAVS
jgi:REP element-mobilizing transposase RayT